MIYKSLPKAIEIVDAFDRTPIQQAAKWDRLKVFKFLAEQWPQGITESPIGDRTVKIAVRAGAIDTVKYILEIFPEEVKSRNNYGCTLLDIATLTGNVELFNYLADLWPKGLLVLDEAGKTVLMTASGRSHLDMVKACLEKCPNLLKMKQHSDQDTAIGHAVSCGRLKTVEYLLGIWPEGIFNLTVPENKSLLTTAASNACFEMVKLIYDKWPEAIKLLDTEKRSPLARASPFCFNSMTFLYEKWPEAIKLKDEYGKTCLHLTARSNLETVKFLVEQWPEN